MDKKKEAKEAVWFIEHCIMNDKCEQLDCGYYGTLSAMDKLLEYIYESEAVVHCKDCKHYNHDKKWCQHMTVANGDTWFCADGEAEEK